MCARAETKLKSALVTCIAWLKSRFWFSRSVLGPRSLRFSQAPSRHCWAKSCMGWQVSEGNLSDLGHSPQFLHPSHSPEHHLEMIIKWRKNKMHPRSLPSMAFCSPGSKTLWQLPAPNLPPPRLPHTQFRRSCSRSQEEREGERGEEEKGRWVSGCHR